MADFNTKIRLLKGYGFNPGEIFELQQIFSDSTKNLIAGGNLYIQTLAVVFRESEPRNEHFEERVLALLNNSNYIINLEMKHRKLQ